jgi:lactoylglutathione lyase
MREFYGTVLGFPLHRELGPQWIEYTVGCNILALTERGLVFDDPLAPVGVLSPQLAFRVAPSEVASCAITLKERGVEIISGATDQPLGTSHSVFPRP